MGLNDLSCDLSTLPDKRTGIVSLSRIPNRRRNMAISKPFETAGQTTTFRRIIDTLEGAYRSSNVDEKTRI